MIDSGRSETDRKLEELEKEIHGIYAQANKELQEKMTEYFRKFKKRDEEKRKQLENGEITTEEYKRWRMGQMATGSRWKSMCDVIAKDMHNSNAIARSVTQGHMAEIYAINHNWTTYDIENKAMLNTNYAMYNSDVVENLLKENPDILPLLRDSDGNIVREKDIAWNKKVINAVMLQGILQGESIDKMAKRFEEVGVRNEKAAVRYARTATTGAENAGRIDGYRRAQKLGIHVIKVWLATLDGRTRDSHRALDGEEQEVEKEFSNGCMHPGDPNCPDPSEVWNCRCTLITKVDGQNYDVSKVKRDSKLGGMSYQEWKEGKPVEPVPKKDSKKPKTKTKSKEKTAESKSEPIQNYAQRIDELITALRKDALTNSTADHMKAMELGRLIMESPDLPYYQYGLKIAEKYKQRNDIISEMKAIEEQATKLVSFEGMVARARYSYLYLAKDKLEKDIKQTKINATDALIDSIYKAREGEKGGKFTFQKLLSPKDIEAKRAIIKASKVYPREWIEDFRRYVHLPLTPVSVGRGQYLGSRIEVSGVGKDAYGSALHELAHGMEDSVKGLIQQERSFYEFRTKGEELQHLNIVDSRYDPNEMARFDDFEDKYMGKDYGGTHFELVSAGFSKLLGGTNPFVYDIDMERWLVGLLCAL